MQCLGSWLTAVSLTTNSKINSEYKVGRIESGNVSMCGPRWDQFILFGASLYSTYFTGQTHNLASAYQSPHPRIFPTVRIHPTHTHAFQESSPTARAKFLSMPHRRTFLVAPSRHTGRGRQNSENSWSWRTVLQVNSAVGLATLYRA